MFPLTFTCFPSKKNAYGFTFRDWMIKIVSLKLLHRTQFSRKKNCFTCYRIFWLTDIGLSTFFSNQLLLAELSFKLALIRGLWLFEIQCLLYLLKFITIRYQFLNFHLVAFSCTRFAINQYLFKRNLLCRIIWWCIA